MAPLEYRSGNHMIHKTKSARTQQRKCIMFKNKTLDLINTFSRQTLCLWLVIVICLISLSSVQSQPLHLPAEQFTCGSHTACERWGYTACVNKDGDPYCMPCSDEYLKSLCGTKEEVQGCNLYCQQEALATERKKMQVEETGKLSRKKTSLGEELDRERSYGKSLEIGIGVLSVIMFFGVVVFLVSVIYKRHQKTKTAKVDTEKGVELPLLDKSKSEKSLSTHSDESGLGNDITIRAIADNRTETYDKVKESEATEQGTDKASQDNRSPEDHCSGYTKLQNIPPTSPASENGSHKLAIR